MVVDKNNHLVICDENSRTVDIVKPPYKSVSSLLGGRWAYPTDVKINVANDRAFVASDGEVVDVYYPGGKPVATIQPVYAASAVGGSNYVP